MTNRISLFVFFMALFLANRHLWAQSSSQGSAPSGANGGGHYVIEQRYIQKLEWIGDQYTLKYEVVIEQNEDGKYSAYIREFTETTSFLVSLPVGKYRYRIIPYDYLEKPGEASEWINVEIKPSPTFSADVQKADGQTVHGVNETADKNPDDSTITEEDENEIPFNLYASAAWSPFIPLYGRLHEIFGSRFNAVGAFVRFGALYNKLPWFSPGVELSTSWYSLNNSQSGDNISVQTGVTGINFVAQKKLPNPKMAVTLRAGFAFAFQVGEINVENYSYTTGGLIPQLNIEASFLWLAWKRLYLEGGVGFAHLINKDGNSGCLRPWLGAGWMF